MFTSFSISNNNALSPVSLFRAQMLVHASALGIGFGPWMCSLAHLATLRPESKQNQELAPSHSVSIENPKGCAEKLLYQRVADFV